MTVKAKELPPQDILKRLFDYNPETGDLFYKERTIDLCKSKRAMSIFNALYAGKKVSSTNGKGYLISNFNGSIHRVHRICWSMVNGYLDPELQIDHENGIKTDNRVCNLRAVTNVQNSQNKVIDHKNTTGVTGVYRSKRDNVWCAQINVNSNKVWLGTFERFEHAVKARKDAEKKYGFHENHGRDKVEND